MRTSLLVLPLVVLVAAPSGAARRMFTTLETGSGDLTAWDANPGALTGVAAGNAICQNLAADAEIPNPEEFRAWLSDGETDAWCNVAGFDGKKIDNCGEPELPDGGPWERIDGKPFARTLAMLAEDFAVLYVPRIDQHGDPILFGELAAWTGTTAGGAAAGDDCSGWATSYGLTNGRSGLLDSGATTWTERSSLGCDAAAHLYCFEAGSGAPLAPFGAPGADAFVTLAAGAGDLGSWDDANGETGIAAGDAICRKAAENGRKPAPESYVAWLSDSGTNAIDRLTIDGPWRRADGVQIAASKATVQLTFHDSSIETDEHGNHLGSFVLTGSEPNGMATGDDCGAWQVASGAATAGQASSAGYFWSGGLGADCSSSSYHLYCFSNVVVVFADGFESGGTTAWSTNLP